MASRAREKPQRRVRVEEIMGTVIGLDLRQPWVVQAAVDRFFDWLRSVDARFSTYRADSLVSRLRRKEISIEETDEDFHEVLALCEEVHAVSRGAFDIWRHSPEGMDPSGLVKGWSIDRGVRMLVEAGARNFCVNAGGDVVACGEASPGLAWRIGIRHPQLPDKMAAVVAGRDLAVATSGAYERGEHILDPATGRPPSGFLSTTVAGPALAFADAYATAAFAMGTNGIGWVAGLPRYSGFEVTRDGRARWTAGFDELMVWKTSSGIRGRRVP
jgi:thiamine biosynthesis lipoprotein